MRFSPLQLIYSQFTAISVISTDSEPQQSPNGEMPYPIVTEKDLEVKIELGQPDGTTDPHDFVVSVGLGNSEAGPTTLPYRFAAQIEGVFHIEHDGELEERKRLVVINGGSMLFGIIREQILSLTLRQKNGPMLLPSLDFRALTEEQKKHKRPRPKLKELSQS